MGFHLTNFELLKPFHSRDSSWHATDRQTDRRTENGHHFIMSPPYGDRGHDNCVVDKDIQKEDNHKKFEKSECLWKQKSVCVPVLIKKYSFRIQLAKRACRAAVCIQLGGIGHKLRVSRGRSGRQVLSIVRLSRPEHPAHHSERFLLCTTSVRIL